MLVRESISFERNKNPKEALFDLTPIEQIKNALDYLVQKHGGTYDIYNNKLKEIDASYLLDPNIWYCGYKLFDFGGFFSVYKWNGIGKINFEDTRRFKDIKNFTKYIDTEIEKETLGKHTESYKIYNKIHKKGKTYEEQMIEKYGMEEGLIQALKYKEKISNHSREKNGMQNKGYLIEGEKNGMFGKISPLRNKKMPEERKKKISESKSGKKRNTRVCIYCNRNIPDGNYTRWHGENCKQKI